MTFSLKNLDPGHPYLSARGLSKETIATFGIGYCSRGMLKGRIAIPIHDERGELVAYAGRFPGDEGLGEGEAIYTFPPNFHKELVVYNLHRAADPAREWGLIRMALP